MFIKHSLRQKDFHYTGFSQFDDRREGNFDPGSMLNTGPRIVRWIMVAMNLFTPVIYHYIQSFGPADEPRF